MFRIGEFSKLTQVSIKALRYYDEVGLLKPLKVDKETGYRYYSASQLPRLNRILALKDLGFSLEQVAQVLNSGVSLEELRGMLRLKQAELLQHITAEQERLVRIEARLTTITQEGTMSDYDVVIKQVQPQLVAGIRSILPSFQAVDRLFDEVYGYLARVGVNDDTLIGAAIWYDEEFKTSDIDGEAVVYLKQPVPAEEPIRVHQLPAAVMASVVHKGAFNRLSQAYEAIMRWIETNGYRIVGPNREVYLYCPPPVRQDDESYFTEIQFPVART